MKIKYNFHLANIKKIFIIVGLALLLPQTQGHAQKANYGISPPKIIEFLGDQPMTRVGRPFVVLATISNPASFSIDAIITLELPKGVSCNDRTEYQIKLMPKKQASFRWTLYGTKPLYEELLLKISNQGVVITVGRLPIRFLPKIKKTDANYIPEPLVPVKKNKNLLVGAHNCPLWEFNSYERWSQLKKHPERTPALGFYAQENPEVADWETKWAVEHGVDFFIYCWYRISQGRPVEHMFGSVLHEALFNSRFKDQIKFSIMWENQNKSRGGVADEKDLLTNLLPFWIENYFKRSNYLIVDNKPALFIYRPENLIENLGSIENVRRALEKMRHACRNEGFDGLWILGEYRGTDTEHLKLMKNLGLDYSFAYCWNIPNSPSPAEAIESQMDKLQRTQDIGMIPQVVTVSQGWSGWKDEGSIWKLPPLEFETLLRQGKAFVEKLPEDDLSGRMILLDNWNEWGEGHYLLPHTEYGFGYLDAIRKVFTNAPENHIDLIPEDINMGPYENAYRKWLKEKRKE